jgi:hypothetical protein
MKLVALRAGLCELSVCVKLVALLYTIPSLKMAEIVVNLLSVYDAVCGVKSLMTLEIAQEVNNMPY